VTFSSIAEARRGEEKVSGRERGGERGRGRIVETGHATTRLVTKKKLEGRERENRMDCGRGRGDPAVERKGPCGEVYTVPGRAGGGWGREKKKGTTGHEYRAPGCLKRWGKEKREYPAKRNVSLSVPRGKGQGRGDDAKNLRIKQSRCREK